MVKMKTRKLIALLVAGVLSLSLALVGCNGGSSGVKYRILDEDITTEQYGVGFRLGDTALRDAVEFTIVEMYNDGTVANIAKKYEDQGILIEGFVLTSTAVKVKPTLDITTFSVGFDQDFPPYGYVDNSGNFAGFDLDMAAEVASRNGWELKLVPINWDLKDAELNSGNIDCIWNGFTITPERETQYLFTQPYMNNSQVFVVRVDSDITTFADLEGTVVMAQSNSAAYSALMDDYSDLVATFKELRTIPEYNSAFLELDQGSIDAIAIDRPVAIYQMNAHS